MSLLWRRFGIKYKDNNDGSGFFEKNCMMIRIARRQNSLIYLTNLSIHNIKKFPVYFKYKWLSIQVVKKLKLFINQYS